MFNREHSCLEAVPHGLVCICMHCDVGVPGPGDIYDGLHLFEGIFGHIDGIVPDETPPPAIALTCEAPMRRASRERFITSGTPSAMRCFLYAEVIQRRSRVPGHIIGPPEIPVARRLRNEGTGRVDTRTVNQAFVGSFLESKHIAAKIPYRGEPPHQHVPVCDSRDQVHVTEVYLQQSGDRYR